MRIALAVCALAATAASFAAAQKRTAKPEPASPLPITRLTLFTSGVAYTERGGEVDGNAAVSISFRTNQINDILKSMVLIDTGGKVQPAVYAAKDPVSHALQSFAIDVTQNLNMQQILEKLRGVEVSVAGERGTVVGRIAGVESRPVVGRSSGQVVVNVATDRGIVSTVLRPGGGVRILDERLDREFRDALALLATGNDEQRRQVSLRFAGEGKRSVRVAYVTEAPLWKMSYRLVMGGAATRKPYLQGWALVENTSDDDWNGVQLSLVSGRPISFIQDLYQPLYLRRPVVAPDIVASPMPQVHGGAMQSDKDVTVLSRGDERGPNGPAGTAGGLGGGFAGRAAGKRAMSESMADAPASAPPALELGAALYGSVEAAATGQQAGELFGYDVTAPVTLPRQQAAMIPVIAGDIDVEKLSLYNADTGPRYPLNAVRVTNNTGLHLKGGPITIFDESTYAGDAKMEDIGPGDNRLLSYAVDLAIEGERQTLGGSVDDVSIVLRRGVLTITRREHRQVAYSLKSRTDKARRVLVEHRYEPEWELLEPKKADERTSDRYRFLVTVPPGKTETLKVAEQRPLSETVAVMNAGADLLLQWSGRTDAPAKLKEVLARVAADRARLQDLQSQAALKDEQVKAINADQDRVRQNMQQLDRTSDLYKRYVKQLDEQETSIQSLRKEAAELRTQAESLDRALRAYVDTITVE